MFQVLKKSYKQQLAIKCILLYHFSDHTYSNKLFSTISTQSVYVMCALLCHLNPDCCTLHSNLDCRCYLFENQIRIVKEVIQQFNSDMSQDKLNLELYWLSITVTSVMVEDLPHTASFWHLNTQVIRLRIIDLCLLIYLFVLII